MSLLLQSFARRLRPALGIRSLQSLASDILPIKLADGTVVTTSHPVFSDDQVLQKLSAVRRDREAEVRSRYGPKIASDLLPESLDQLFREDRLLQTICQAQTARVEEILYSDPTFEMASDILPTAKKEDVVMQSMQEAEAILMDDLEDVVYSDNFASDVLPTKTMDSAIEHPPAMNKDALLKKLQEVMAMRIVEYEETESDVKSPPDESKVNPRLQTESQPQKPTPVVRQSHGGPVIATDIIKSNVAAPQKKKPVVRSRPAGPLVATDVLGKSNVATSI